MGGAIPECFAGRDPDALKSVAAQATNGADGGELFLESHLSEFCVREDGALRSAGSSSHGGFGVRATYGDRYACSHADGFNIADMRRAADFVGNIAKYGDGGTAALKSDLSPRHPRHERALYGSDYPLSGISVADRARFLAETEDYVRSLDKRVTRTTLSLSAELQVVAIIDKHGICYDIRPLFRCNIGVIMEENGRRERGSYGYGGRAHANKFFSQSNAAAEEALRRARVNLSAEEAPAGEMQVALGSGWPGVLLHEAVGHGLEGDFNRKKTSAFCELMGKRVAAKGVDVVDDGSIPNRRGSLTVDDEGTPTGETVLIEDGILKAYMCDKMNARLLGVAPTGNGRRESYRHPPLPRMTNTFMRGGEYSSEEIIASIDDGVYAPDFAGGQVDVTSGKFVFSAAEAYRVKKGKILHAVRGATLIGNGPDVLTRIKMVGNDSALDQGVGTCGKAGQGVPVGVGQPTLRIDAMTVGGTAL